MCDLKESNNHPKGCISIAASHKLIPGDFLFINQANMKKAALISAASTEEKLSV
ncbi:hypothetical protein L3081_23780 [Colwellia sp. MSW7]|uniref:Uncharacterized protein n=1 Tax=Colwellia maritima TaxID=2912588 RepID=A0ABS9X6H8_9GAMM|nr:hypothetical protein [Colwellia maritima]MCI2285850.1 hypothetical protein [Colwellia maritima]